MTAAALHLDAISKGYGPTRVLDGISLAIAPGEFTALIGPVRLRQVHPAERLIAGLDRARPRPDPHRERDVTTVRAAATATSRWCSSPTPSIRTSPPAEHGGAAW